MNGQEIKSQTSAKQTNTRAQPNQTNRRPKKTDRRLHATTRHPRSISQERMKAKKVNTPYRPYFQGNPNQVIFRHGTQFFHGKCYQKRCVDVLVGNENACTAAWAIH